MADDEKVKDLPEKKGLKPNAEELWSQVEFGYSTYQQFTLSNKDVRFLFADEIPPDGKARPLFGVVMTHSQARSFAKMLETVINALDTRPENKPEPAK